MNKRLVAGLFALLLCSCTIGPEYQRPPVDVPLDWRLNDNEATDLADTAWWQQCNDPVLDELITAALQENKDLHIAAARIEEFAGRYGITRSGLFPQIGADGQYDRQRVTESSDNPLSPGYQTTTGSYSTTLNVSWEIDLWGRIRRATESARAQLLASEEGRQGVILSLIGDVASAYINLRAL
ncbi:MAG: TolC family protein, partial [Desulfobulbus sp.]|nr:TolC family protein [Desulfobulbus sp.]